MQAKKKNKSAPNPNPIFPWKYDHHCKQRYFLADNGIRDAGVVALAESLCVNASLRELHLGGVPLAFCSFPPFSDIFYFTWFSLPTSHLNVFLPLPKGVTSALVRLHHWQGCCRITLLSTLWEFLVCPFPQGFLSKKIRELSIILKSITFNIKSNINNNKINKISFPPFIPLLYFNRFFYIQPISLLHVSSPKFFPRNERIFWSQKFDIPFLIC